MVEEADGWDSGRPGSEYAGLVLFGCARETCATVEQVDGWVWNVQKMGDDRVFFEVSSDTMKVLDVELDGSSLAH